MSLIPELAVDEGDCDILNALRYGAQVNVVDFTDFVVIAFVGNNICLPNICHNRRSVMDIAPIV